ncbi:MAG: acyltransferase, partial [Proteobacteria bacterium]|nr:acyltransferase [Pseudomonadota bacterium]
MAQGASSFDQQDHLQVVDALRGYAILLVIFSHATPYVPQLVWPAKRFFLLGTYGVQLFFIASALTLLMSWGRSRDPLGVRSVRFFVRRFFRIAPLYFLAIPFYWVVKHQVAADFSLETLLATLFFYNAWSPYLIPTVPGWIAVPGGWSIGVEFCFYFIFPLLAASVDSLRRALVFFVVALAIMIAASSFGAALYPEIGSEARGTFLYFWPPNQLAIFALGFVLYHAIKSDVLRQHALP